MAKTKPSAHAELHRLRERAAAERVKQRGLADELDAARRRVAEAERQVAEGYELEDSDAVDAARDVLVAAKGDVDDLGHRHAAADARIRAAQQVADQFVEEHAESLIAERVSLAAEVTGALCDSVHDVLRLHERVLDARTEIDRLISASGGSPRLDGPPDSHAWEGALTDMRRAVQAVPRIDPPAPRWLGRRHAEERDRVALFVHAQRRGQSAVERLGPW